MSLLKSKTLFLIIFLYSLIFVISAEEDIELGHKPPKHHPHRNNSPNRAPPKPFSEEKAKRDDYYHDNKKEKRDYKNLKNIIDKKRLVIIFGIFLAIIAILIVLLYIFVKIYNMWLSKKQRNFYDLLQSMGTDYIQTIPQVSSSCLVKNDLDLIPDKIGGLLIPD